MEDRPHPAALPDDQLLRSCEVTRGRRGGPGGQHRNKVETAIRITHTTSGTTAEASERRSQKKNHDVAVFRLRMKLALAVRTPWTAPSPLWQTRSRGRRLSINPQHQDAPTLLAESLDAARAHQWDDRTTAETLSINRTQLMKFWRAHPAALEYLNTERQAAELSKLR